MKKVIITLVVIILLLLGILGVVLYNALKEKTPITAENFISTMEQKGYIVIDISQIPELSEFDFINEAYVAVSSDESHSIEFYELADEEYAINAYLNNKSTFESYKGGSSTEKTANSINASKYTLTANGKYMVVSRIDNTFILANVDEEFADTIKTILKEIRY